jgi:hypothetical protein
MKVAPEHVQELLQLLVWELSRALSQQKREWIVSLPGLGEHESSLPVFL